MIAIIVVPIMEIFFLGGVDGLLYMNDSQSSIPEYYPEVILRKLIIDREEVNLNRFIRQTENRFCFLKNRIRFLYNL